MKVNKFVGFFFVFFLPAIFCVNISEGTDFINLYRGVNFQSKFNFYLTQFFQFSCYSLYIYHDFSKYMKEYGIFVVTRTQNRTKLLKKLMVILLRYMIELEVIKIVSFICVMRVVKGSITVEDITKSFAFVLGSIVINYVIFFMQMLIEINYSSSIALYSILSFNIISFCISDVIYKSDFISNQLCICLLPNLLMEKRIESLAKNNLFYMESLFFIIVFSVIIFCVAKRNMKTRDFI